MDKWISVKGRLPLEIQNTVGKIKGVPCSELCIVAVESPFSSAFVAIDITIHGRWYHHGEAVTHWMPLPEQPKED